MTLFKQPKTALVNVSLSRPTEYNRYVPTELEEAIESLEEIFIATHAEAVKIIDEGLVSIGGRDLVSASEVADLLLDVRQMLTINLSEIAQQDAELEA